MKRTIILYETRDGKCPIKEFFNSLPIKVMQKIAWVLQLVQELEKIPTIYFKKLAGNSGIWECRIQLGSNIYRLFCFFDDGTMVVLTHGIQKKSQKTPVQEIEKAVHYRQDYLGRKR